MSAYRRYYVPGGTYFFTVVTERRAELFKQEPACRLLGITMRRCFERFPTTVIAMVLLPDHLHALWTLPTGDDRYPLRWRWIKREFTRAWLASGGREQGRSESRIIQRHRGVWQRRFWEHTIEDERDLENHFDYIHFNPVKHGLASSAKDWPWSTFHRYVTCGHYEPGWASSDPNLELPGE